MQEAFLHYLWQARRYRSEALTTTDNEPLTVLKTGFLNSDAGPDFTDARLRVGAVEWAGSVEMHLRASEWYNHRHELDRAYDNVILHVVWEYDRDVFRPDGSKIPTLVLQPLTAPQLIEMQQYLLENRAVIPCESHFAGVDEMAKVTALSRALTQRLQQKAAEVTALLATNHDDWEETAYQVLVRNFGFKLNAEPMLQLARQLPLKILQKHRNNPRQIEAMLFGTAGLLNNAEGDYAKLLRQEYDFLGAKYGLKAKELNAHAWKFLRTRPANFPTIRLAQLASLISSQRSFFSLFTQTTDLDSLKKALAAEQPDYWQRHYHFEKPLAKPLKKMGTASIENVLINTVVPVVVAYAQYIDNQSLIERAESFLESLPPEKNRITEQWEGLGMAIKNSYDSQASIELFRHFCEQKRCLQCRIGNAILQATSG